MSATVATHPGRVRSENQDTALVPGFCSTGLTGSPVTFHGPPDGAAAVYAVIDGMGGHSGGRTASQSAAFYLADCAARAAEELDVTAMLNGVNRLLYEQMERDQRLLGMGATIAGVAFGPRQATVFNVGDARVYSCGDGYTMLLTTDDRSSPSSHAVNTVAGRRDQADVGKPAHRPPRTAAAGRPPADLQRRGDRGGQLR